MSEKTESVGPVPMCPRGSQLGGIAVVGGCWEPLVADVFGSWPVYTCACGKTVDRVSADEAVWGALLAAAPWHDDAEAADPHHAATGRRARLWQWTRWVTVDPYGALSCSAAVRLAPWAPHPARHRVGIHCHLNAIDQHASNRCVAPAPPRAVLGVEHVSPAVGRRLP